MYKRNIHWYIKKIRSMSAPYFFYCCVLIYYSAGISAGAEVSSTGAVSAAGVTAGAGVLYSVPVMVCISFTGFTRDPLCTRSRGITNTLKIDSTPIIQASVHVAFSMKSLVRRTPMIWFEPAKDDERPPPFDF